MKAGKPAFTSQVEVVSMFFLISTVFKLGVDLIVLAATFYLGVKAQQKYPSVIAKIPYLKPTAATTTTASN